MKKILRNKESIKATRKFTDREVPRVAFWNKYNLMKQNISNIEDIYVLTYYGVGGIGKSTLLRKIIEELNEKEEKPYYLLYDFETAQDVRAVLSMMKNKMEKDYKFQFPIFDLALYAYAKKIGESAEKPEVKSMVEQSKILSFIIEGVGELPVIGMASKILKLADSGLALIKNISKKYKSELIKMENETAEETFKKLPYYFSQDLADNVEKLDKPFVIFLDTYEKLVNEVKDDGYSLMKDMWLRDEKGPILQVPGILWVIAGREKIKWGEYDKDWDETLNQHILGDLSSLDTDYFLQEAGIIEENLRKEIYKLTNGTPVYLDICVSTYEILKEKNEQITIDKFGINVDILVERFIRYMDNQSSEITYLLSLIGNWNDKMIDEIAFKILPNFSIILYEKIKKLSFVFCENDSYYIHKTVREIFKKECPQLIKEKFQSVMEEYYFEFIDKESSLNNNFMNAVNNYIEICLNSISKENVDDKIINIDMVLYNLDKSFLFVKLNELTAMIYQKLKKEYSESKNFYLIEMQYARVKQIEGNSVEAVEIYEKVAEYLMENNMFDIFTFQRIVNMMCEIKLRDRAKIFKLLNYIETYDKEKIEDIDIPGFNSCFYSVQALLYELLNNHNKALKMYEEILKIEKRENSKCAIMCNILAISNFNESVEKKYTYFVNELEALIENDVSNIKEKTKFYVMLNISDIYRRNTIYNLNKALYWIDKAEKYKNDILENSGNVFLKELVLRKVDILHKMNEKELLEKYILKIIDEINNNYDVDNIEIESLLLKLFEYVDKNKKLSLYNELFDKYTKNGVDIEALYIIIEGISVSSETEILRKYLNVIFDEIKKCGLNENNIDIFEDIIYKNSVKIDDDKTLEQKICKCYEYYKAQYGENSKNMVGLLTKTMALYEKKGKFDKAVEVGEKIRKINIQKYEEDSLEVAEITNVLSIAYNDLGKLEKAIEYSQKSLDIYNKFLSEGSEEVLKVECNIAMFYYTLDAKKGIEKLEAIYKKVVNLFGEENETTIPILENLAKIKYDNNYDLDEVISLFKKIYDYYVKVFGSNSVTALGILRYIGLSYFNNGQSEEALKVLEEIYVEYNKVLKPNDEKIIGVMQDLSNIYNCIGDYKKAIEIETRLYELYKQLYGEDDEKVLTSLYFLAKYYRKLEQYDEEIKCRTKRYEILKRKNNNVETEKSVETLIYISNAYVLNKDFIKGKELAIKTYEELKKLNLSNDNKNHLIYMNNLLRSFIDCNMKEEARELMNVLRPLANKYLDKDTKLYELILEKEKQIEAM